MPGTPQSFSACLAAISIAGSVGRPEGEIDTMDEETQKLDSDNGTAHGEMPISGLADTESNADQTLSEGLGDEVAVMRDRWMRAEAETANVRARAKRDVDAAKQYAVQKFATDVVEAAENLRRGIESIPPARTGEAEIVTQLRDGFAGVERSFIDLLKRNGIEKHDATGVPFDSGLHLAISEKVSVGHAPGTVLHAASAAWTLNGRLLRPAMVVVAKSHNTAPPEQAQST
jgi:molecular chaperone GrpE